MKKCNLFVAIGTSGTVYPAAGFVEVAKAYGAETHRFDTDLTRGSHRFDSYNIGEAAQTLPKWVDELIGDRT